MQYPSSKNSVFQVILSMLMLGISSVSATETKRFAWPEGTVTYKVAGACKGTEILKWKDYGFRKAIYATNKLSLLGFTEETKTLVLSKGSVEYSINLNEMSGTVKTNDALDKLYSSDNEVQNINLRLLIEQGAVKVGKKTILETQCTEWQVKQGKNVSTTCLTDEGIPLEIISSVPGGTHHSIAVNMNREPVADEEVGLPKDIKIQSNSAAGQKLVKALKQTQQSKETLNCLAHKKPSVVEKTD